VRAVVLAAGWARRLGDLGAGRPKSLLPVGERTPLDWVVDALEAIEELQAIDVVTHDAYRPHFDAWIGRRAARTALRVRSNRTRWPQERLGAVGDLHRYLQENEVPGPLLVLGADMVFDGRLAALAGEHPGELAIAVHDVGSHERVRQLASVEVGADGRVQRFVEKDPEPRTTLAAPAMYRLPADALGEVEDYLSAGGGSDNLGHLVAWWVERRPVRAVRLEGRWIDIGTPEEYERAQREFGDTSG
jgi:glucose-1-phosphate thymidylyltransferase